MKKILVFIIAAVLILSFAACAGNVVNNSVGDDVDDTADDTVDDAEADGGLMGGWTVNDDKTAAHLPSDVQDAFDKATQNFVGSDLIPLAYIGSQVVAGMNYSILCKGVTVTANPVTSLKVVTIYKDLEGNAEIKNIADFHIDDYTDREGIDEDAEMLAGGWAVPEEYSVINLPADVAKAFDTALEGFVGNNIEPMAYLGSQIVAGTNYAVLCHSALVTADSISSIQVVIIYADLQGGAEIINISTVDPADYNE